MKSINRETAHKLAVEVKDVIIAKLSEYGDTSRVLVRNPEDLSSVIPANPIKAVWNVDSEHFGKVQMHIVGIMNDIRANSLYNLSAEEIAESIIHRNPSYVSAVACIYVRTLINCLQDLGIDHVFNRFAYDTFDGMIDLNKVLKRWELAPHGDKIVAIVHPVVILRDAISSAVGDGGNGIKREDTFNAVKTKLEEVKASI